MTDKRESGQVGWFHKRRGFGVITDSEGKEVFVHFSDVVSDGFKVLVEGQKVEFTAQVDAKGKRIAKEVTAANGEKLETPPRKPPSARVSKPSSKTTEPKVKQVDTGVNLNPAFPHFHTAAELYAHIRELTKQGGDYTVRNFVGVIEDISVEASTVETELFPRGALEYYTKKNMGEQYTQQEHKQWFDPSRGGDQGDYRDGMPEKIANVIDCLKTEPKSKRAIIPIPFSAAGSKTVNWKDQGQTKCCRELHFYIENNKLCCTGILRMQNASIFPKNIHFFATVIDQVAKELGLQKGEYTHWITNLCHDRSAHSC
jgi:CspA family cold shock protein